MASSPSSPGSLDAPSGPYGLRDIRSVYPTITDTHLRYLEKWGLLSQTTKPHGSREYSFSDLLTIKQLAGELERGRYR